MDDDHPVQVSDIAARIGKTRDNVNAWRKRGTDGFPSPDWELRTGATWRWGTIKRWLRASGRGHLIPDDD